MSDTRIAGDGLRRGQDRFGPRRNAACEHPAEKVQWSGQWLERGVGLSKAMKGKCACGQTVVDYMDNPHSKIPSQNPYHRDNASPEQAFKVGDEVVAEPVPGACFNGRVTYAGEDGAVEVMQNNGSGDMYEQRMVRHATKEASK